MADKRLVSDNRFGIVSHLYTKAFQSSSNHVLVNSL